MKIQIKYILTKSEYIEAFEVYEKTKKQYFIDLILSILICVMGISFALISKEVFTLIMGVVIAIFGLLTITYKFRVSRLIIGFQFKNNPKSKYEQSITFTENGLDYEIQNAKSQIKWDYYNNFIMSKNTLILIYGPRQYSIIPKKAFNELDLEELIKFCHGKIRPATVSN